ncbi:MAG: Wzz/FepE/Etk N-terminal domain-containing protein [Hydrogenophaga sp.]|nr:Wzz/FepE/Etk N-terminal domain-containing protein [Hydrogenophaga sp.]
MNTATPVIPPPQDSDPDELDLRKLVATLWRQRLTIVAIGVGGALLGIAVSLMSTKYVSSGLFEIPLPSKSKSEVSFSEGTVNATNYKRYENTLINSRNFEQFLESRVKRGEAAATDLMDLAKRPTGLSQAISPEFSLTEKEQRGFGIKLSSDDANALVGFRVRYAANEPTNGTALVLLGEYLRDSITRLDLKTKAESQCTRNELREAQLLNEQLAAKFHMEQEEERIQRLQQLIAQNPSSAAQDTRQVISLDNNGARFLAPRTHLNASEIVVTDIKLGQKQRDRERVASAIKKSYYCEASKLLDEPASAEELLDKLPALQTAALKDQDNKLDIVQQTQNELRLELDTWRSNYLRTMKYVADPKTLENKERKPGLALGLLGGGMLGGLFGLFFALLQAWWRDNREAVLTPES